MICEQCEKIKNPVIEGYVGQYDINASIQKDGKYYCPIHPNVILNDRDACETKEEWQALKAAEQYNMYLQLLKRIEALEAMFSTRWEYCPFTGRK